MQPLEDDVPESFGRYEALFRIAAGGMAEVYAARLRGEAGFTKLVALKRMLPNLAEDDQFVTMFLDEARVASNISSPHVVSTLDLGRATDGSLYIIMDLVLGVTLSQILRSVARDGEMIPTEVAVELLGQAAQGLHDAHEATTPMGQPLGIVHRDVSPQNILVGLDGRVRITDFGVARAILRLSQTTTGQLKGKFAYFAPEQVKGGSNIDKRSDVFALGIVAWETFTGRRLFAAENPMATMDLVRSMPIPNPTELRPDLPPAVSEVVMAALDRDVSRRMRSAGEFAHKLRNTARKAGLELPHGDVISQYVRATGGEQLQKIQRSIKRALAHQDTATDIKLEPSDLMSLDEPTPTHDGTRSGIVESQAGGTGRPRGPTLQTAAIKPRPQLMPEPASQPSQPSHPSNPSVPGHPRYAREQSQPAFVGHAPGQMQSWPSASGPSGTPILEAPPQRSGSGKMIAIAAIAVVLAAGIGGGIAYYSGSQQTPAVATPLGPPPATAAPSASGAGLGLQPQPAAPDQEQQVVPVAADPAGPEPVADVEEAVQEQADGRGGTIRRNTGPRRRNTPATGGGGSDLSQIAAAAERRQQVAEPEPPIRPTETTTPRTQPAETQQQPQAQADPPRETRRNTGSQTSTQTQTQTQPQPTKRTGPGFSGLDAFDQAAARRRRQGGAN